MYRWYFINEKILTKRDDGGDDFKELNFHLDNLPDRQGKNNKGMFIQVAMRLRSKIFKPEQIKECKDRNINIWNSEYANVVTLSKREEYEKLLIKLIEMNFVNSYEDVKSAIDKLINNLNTVSWSYYTKFFNFFLFLILLIILFH